MLDTVTGCGVGDYDIRKLRQLEIESWWPEELARAEATIRKLRTQLEALLAETPRVCERCRLPMGGRADRKYCSPNCRQAAFQSNRKPKVDWASRPTSIAEF